MDVWAMAASLYRMLTGCVPRDFPPAFAGVGERSQLAFRS
jgi:hypothetical protein